MHPHSRRALRRNNVDTCADFGEPVFVNSLKDGINDGCLTWFRVKRISTTFDEYVYTPDDTLVEGEIEVGKRCEEADCNKIIEIRKREKWVEFFMSQIDQRESTLVFCAAICAVMTTLPCIIKESLGVLCFYF